VILCSALAAADGQAVSPQASKLVAGFNAARLSIRKAVAHCHWISQPDCPAIQVRADGTRRVMITLYRTRRQTTALYDILTITDHHMITNAEEFVGLRSSTNPDEYYRAAHEPAPEVVWYDIIARYPQMRSWVAHNKTVPIAILDRLSSDSDPHVRTMVAMKRKLPERLQVRLAHDPDSGVRHQLACNAKVTRNVLQILAADSELFIREQAQKRLATETSP